MEAVASLAGMFAVAFGAATLLPFQSEIVFAALQLRAEVGIVALVVTASLGNTAGSVVNYLVGLGVERFRHRRWFPISERQLDRAQRWYARWGVWTLLLSWAPFADPITMAAGVMRTRFWLFLVLVALAKTGRYVALAWLAEGTLGT